MHWIGEATVANKKALFVTLMDRVPHLKHIETSFFDKFDWFIVLTSRLHVLAT